MTPGRQVTILDGATGTELERRGVDISLPLWSARALVAAPDVLADVHRDYLDAGADAITANTFRTHHRTLACEPDAPDATELTQTAVRIARAVRDEHKPGALVLGSVAPLEDCYRPDLAPGADDCAREHAQLIATLVEAGVDRVLIETMNNITETRAAVDAARRSRRDRRCLRRGCQWFVFKLYSLVALGEGPSPRTPTMDRLRVCRDLARF